MINEKLTKEQIIKKYEQLNNVNNVLKDGVREKDVTINDLRAEIIQLQETKKESMINIDSELRRVTEDANTQITKITNECNHKLRILKDDLDQSNSGLLAFMEIADNSFEIREADLAAQKRLYTRFKTMFVEESE